MSWRIRSAASPFTDRQTLLGRALTMPFTLRRGSPPVILTRDPMGRELNALLCVYGTHTVYGVHSEVPVGPEDDFDQGTVLNADNLQLVYQDELVEHVGAVREETLAAICRAVAFAIACPVAR